jgi:5-methylcytosine-specific restriction endonuclease McrA
MRGESEALDQSTIRYNAQTRTVQDLVHLFQDRQLNLNPGFQRESVWSHRDRAKLVDSILRRYPIPAIFLHETHKDGSIVYHVIDGKQRIESIFRFMGVIRGGVFSAKTILPAGDAEEIVTWQMLKRRHAQHRLEGYQLQVIFVEADDLSQIIELFVRINSTGRALNRQEKAHAKFYRSHFLKRATNLAETLSPRLVYNRVLSENQISRMKHVELISELMLSVHYGDVIHKKRVLEEAMSEKGLPPRAVERALNATRLAFNRTLRMFPNLRETRFCQVSDFYTLVLLVHKLEREHCILTKPSRNRIAAALLSEFGAAVDGLRHLQKRLERIPADMDLYRSYLQTVLEGTDTSQNRKGREKILVGLFGSLFERKDPWRIFTSEQRRVIWQSNKKKLCIFCRKPVGWENFTIDHVLPHSRGGRTALVNAALAHKSCNSSAGDKRGRTS